MKMNRFPENKRFAFTIFDDTDLSTVENVGAVYRLLEELGLRTTKSVWPLASDERARLAGASLQHPQYLRFVLDLQRAGFEIALHNVRNTGSKRERVAAGLEEFRRLIGHYPRVHANHAGNRDNLYWGPARFSTIAPLYRAMQTFYDGSLFEGHLADSEYFWGDLCKCRIDYVRNFVFREINLDRVNPHMPYQDPRRGFVNAWFSSSDGADVEAFCSLLSEGNQDRLETEAGVCIVYTHFACGFVEEGRVLPRVKALLRRLAAKNGWFVPVSTLLDFLRERHQTLSIPAGEITAMECRWLSDRLKIEATKLLRKLRRRPETVTTTSNVSA
jgi:hypothetical protein